MYAGFDRVRGFQLYCSDPSGNYAAYKAHATGKNSVGSITTLKDDYQEECNLNEAVVLAAKILAKSMDTVKPEASRFEISVVHKDAQGNLVQRPVEGAELEQVM